MKYTVRDLLWLIVVAALATLIGLQHWDEQRRWEQRQDWWEARFRLLERRYGAPKQ